MLRVAWPVLALMLCITAIRPANADVPPLEKLERMPVREVTVFKDGHALVLHAGTMPTDDEGNVLLDDLPSPILGTFWSFSSDPRATLTATKAGQHRVGVTRTALNLAELIEANAGSEVIVKEFPETTGPGAAPGPVHRGVLVGIPERSADELEQTGPRDGVAQLPQKGTVVLLKTEQGMRVIDLARIQDIAFTNEYAGRFEREELRNLLTLRLAWNDGKPQPQAEVGMLYMQKGIRWIPSYHVEIDGSGNAVVKLQGVLINELRDLDDVTMHCVVGVPTFAFADTRDPISLQQAVAQLSSYFQQPSVTAAGLAHGLTVQSRMSEAAVGLAAPSATAVPATQLAGRPAPSPGPEIEGSEKNEDLFIYTINHVTLQRGERMIVPIGEFKLTYRDVYKLDLPFTPPAEMWRQYPTHQQAELARTLAAPKFMHVLRFTNGSAAPLTTAPAMIVRDGKVVAHAIMTYTPSGGEVDVAITPAVDLVVKKSDKETGRTPNAENWNGHKLVRIDLQGKIAVTNHSGKPVEIEITRHVLGRTDGADQDGAVEMLNLFEDNTYVPSGPAGGRFPQWFLGNQWPVWWSQFNSVGRITWKGTLDARESREFTYSWHYYWQ